jgi:hypothetical protein
MMGTKERHFAPLLNVSVEQLGPQDHFYRHLERTWAIRRTTSSTVAKHELSWPPSSPLPRSWRTSPCEGPRLPRLLSLEAASSAGHG